MSDLIDRQGAIDAIMEEPSEVRYPTFYAEKIRQLKSAQSEQRWIPVTERLPEKHSSAIVTDFGHVTLAYTNNFDEWMDYDGNRLKNVTAWMPLPEPYRKETEGAKENS